MVQTLGLELSLFLFAAFIGYVFAIRIGQSAVIGMIIIGIVLGPSFLGLVQYDGTVKMLSEIGIILLLFVIGLESDFRQIYSVKNSIIALFGVIVPFAAGFAFSKAYGYQNLESIFIAATLTATSIAITAHVLKEMGKLGTESAKAIIGAAVIDDVLGLLVLAMIGSAGKGDFSIQATAITALSAVIFFMIVYLLMPFVSEIVSRVDDWAESAKQTQVTMILAMAIAFAYSAITELIGLSAIVGSFVAGVTLGNVSIKSYREGAAYLEMIFSSIFFISLGILIDLRSADYTTAIFTGALIIIAIATKVIGCYLPALFTGMKPKEALIVGIGMVPRGEVAMIVALVGLTSGIIVQSTYTAIVIMALITTLAAPAALRKLYS
ncbi:cation:proton antiporter [Candidatus Woesearchaeota archaeon]|nr:cation:proton antiporter [Candidatus Woesearchaeota archaeon]